MNKKKLAVIIVPCIIAIVVAIFMVNRTYTLATDVNPTGAGSVSPSGGEYKSGAQVGLAASPASGYTFDHWSGDASGNTSTITIMMDSDKSLIAHFAEEFTLNVSFYPSVGGNVSPSGGVYKSGFNITLTASPASGYAFDHWEGDVIGTSPSMTITMTHNTSVTAHFKPTLVILSHQVSAEWLKEEWFRIGGNIAYLDILSFTVKGQAQNRGVHTIRSVRIVVEVYTKFSVFPDYLLAGEASSSYYDIEPNQIFDFEVNGRIDTDRSATRYEISVADIQY